MYKYATMAIRAIHTFNIIDNQNKYIVNLNHNLTQLITGVILANAHITILS